MSELKTLDRNSEATCITEHPGEVIIFSTFSQTFVPVDVIVIVKDCMQ